MGIFSKCKTCGIEIPIEKAYLCICGCANFNIVVRDSLKRKFTYFDNGIFEFLKYEKDETPIAL